VKEAGKLLYQKPNTLTALQKSVKITSELEAVTKTLTENELAVLRALLNHGGCMIRLI